MHARACGGPVAPALPTNSHDSAASARTLASASTCGPRASSTSPGRSLASFESVIEKYRATFAWASTVAASARARTAASSRPHTATMFETSRATTAAATGTRAGAPLSCTATRHAHETHTYRKPHPHTHIHNTHPRALALARTIATSACARTHKRTHTIALNEHNCAVQCVRREPQKGPPDDRDHRRGRRARRGVQVKQSTHERSRQAPARRPLRARHSCGVRGNLWHQCGTCRPRRRPRHTSVGVRDAGPAHAGGNERLHGRLRSPRRRPPRARGRRREPAVDSAGQHRARRASLRRARQDCERTHRSVGTQPGAAALMLACAPAAHSAAPSSAPHAATRAATSLIDSTVGRAARTASSKTSDTLAGDAIEDEPGASAIVARETSGNTFPKSHVTGLQSWPLRLRSCAMDR